LLSSGDVIQIAERTTTSFWDGSEINAPGLGANASLAMCLLPVLFFGRGDERKGLFYPLVAFPVSIMLAAGLFINVTLQNRTPFLAMAASLLIGTVLYLHRHKREPSRAIKKVAVLGLLAGAVVYFLATSVDLSQLDIVTRFTEERLESLRYESWKTMLSSLHQSLLGGRAVRLGADLNYVHNLWLDVIWDAGIVPFLFLAAFHLKHARCFKNIMRSDLPLLILLVVIVTAISFFANFMQEPTLSASVPYFAASCFFLGLVLRMSQDLEEHAEGL
jgi:drug/metabolite transporter (DMT)-like permease